MQEIYKKFQEYKWTESKEWFSYLDNIFPNPPINKIPHYKKKFYKLKIDPEFDINYEPAPENSSTRPNSSTNNQQNPYTNPPSGVSPTINGILQKNEVLFWVFFLPSIIFQISPLKISAIALLLRTIRRVGFPKFKMEYAQHLCLDEHFQLLLYSLLFMVDRLNIFVLVPLAITGLMSVTEFIKITGFTFLSKYTDSIYNRRVELAKLRSNIELAIGFFLVVGIFFGLNSLLTPIFYWQFLRFKYIVNQDTKNTFTLLNSYVTEFKNKPSVPSFVRYAINKVQQFANYLGRTEATEGQAAGGQNCVIF